LGVGDSRGTLERGRLGDLLLLNASDYREIPLLAGTNLTYLMMKRGVVMFKEDFAHWPARD
jgi:imidazolonepropionase-like amidohydrolase